MDVFQGYQGSIPLSEVESMVRRKHPEAWRMSTQWRSFCEDHPDVFVIEARVGKKSPPPLIQADDRMRLRTSTHWRSVDQQTERFKDCMVGMLRERMSRCPNNTMRLDAVVRWLAKDNERPPHLPIVTLAQDLTQRSTDIVRLDDGETLLLLHCSAAAANRP